MYFIFQTCRIVLHLDYFSSGFFCVTFLFCLAQALFFTAALIPDFMYRCVLVGLLLTFYFYRNIRRAPAAPPCPSLPQQLFFLVGLCCLTRVEGLCSIGLESKECMRCGGLFPAPSQIFIFYAELGGLFFGEWRIYRTRSSLTFLDRRSHACLYRVITCTPFFFFFVPLTSPEHTHTHKTIFQKREWTLKAEEAPRRARCPLSPPPLLHSPYLPPLFARQPPCSALMRGHPPLLGWRKGGVSPERSRDTRHVGCLLFFCFLCIFFFSFSVWFPWQWLSRIYILVTCLKKK